MDAKVPELLDLTKSLLDQSVEIVDDSVPSSERVPAEEVRYSIFLRVQMREALKFGYGAYHSCNNGWAHGGIGAARSMYEILLDIKYINHDETRKDERFTRFLDHGAEYLYLKMERELRLGGQISQKEQDELRDKYNQLKKKYKNMHEQDVKSGIAKPDATPRYRKYNWAGLDLTEKVEEVNLDTFHQLYKELAELSHVSMGATLRAIERFAKDQIEVDMNLNPGPVHCYKVLDVAFTCLSGILEEYMAYFEIEHSSYPILGNLWRDYKELLNK